MSKQIFKSAKKAVRNAYAKAAIGYGSLGALATGFYLNAQRIAENYVPGGIWNPEAYHAAYPTNWGSEGVFAALSVAGAIFFGAVAATGGPIKFKAIYDKSKTQTELDKKRKKITQTKPRFLDKNETFFARKEDSFKYDAILSVKVNQGPLQRKANIGDLEITAIRLDELKEKAYEGESELVEKVFTIPYQEAPFNLRKKLSKELPKHNDLKGNLRKTFDDS